MKALLLMVSSLLVMSWDGWYAKKGTCSRSAKEGGLAALQEWKERLIDE